MHRKNLRINGMLALALAAILVLASPAVAEKSSSSGSGNKGGKHEQQEKHGGKKGHDDGSSGSHPGEDGKGGDVYFGDHHREVIRGYYQEQYRSGHCPSGLAKKDNGCMPPGHAKRWVIGRQLPPDIILHDLPEVVIVQLGPPPPGHRYVRVDSDVLLLAIGTGMVIDALQNLTGN